MKVLIIGGAGMIGRKLAERLAKDGALGGKAITKLTLHDVVPGAAPAGAKMQVAVVTGDLPAAGEADKLIADRPDVIFHLAAIVSGEAEQDFDKGYRINMDGTRNLLEAVRKAGHKPRLVFSSSIAVFGAPFPEAIGDEFFNTPLTSYGTQKNICELLITDYSRKGFVDGISIRLPTICVRPGKPNKAASGFFSNIIREPLAGHEAVLPVSESVMHWHASPRAAVGFMLHSATLDLGQARLAPGADHAGPRRHSRRADRGAEEGRRRQGRGPHPPRAGCLHRGHRRRLAAQLRAQARARARLQGRSELRGHHPHPHRGRIGRAHHLTARHRLGALRPADGKQLRADHFGRHVWCQTLLLCPCLRRRRRQLSGLTPLR